jgi:hypothetical protein
MGPITILDRNKHPRQPSLGGHQYILVVTDELTRSVFIRLMKQKSETPDLIISIIDSLEKQTGREVKRFHCDKGTEFVNSTLKKYLSKRGINLTTSSPGKSEHNGLAERVNRIIQTIIRALMVQSGATVLLWGEAALWAVHIINYTPRQSSGWVAPFTLLFNRQFNPRRFKVWGCDAFVLLSAAKQTKFQARAWRGVMVGYDPGTGGYRIWRPATNLIYCTKDVDFIETQFTHMKITHKRNLSVNIPIVLSTPNSYTVLGESINDQSQNEDPATQLQSSNLTHWVPSTSTSNNKTYSEIVSQAVNNGGNNGDAAGGAVIRTYELLPLPPAPVPGPAVSFGNFNSSEMEDFMECKSFDDDESLYSGGSGVQFSVDGESDDPFRPDSMVGNGDIDNGNNDINDNNNNNSYQMESNHNFESAESDYDDFEDQLSELSETESKEENITSINGIETTGTGINLAKQLALWNPIQINSTVSSRSTRSGRVPTNSFNIANQPDNYLTDEQIDSLSSTLGMGEHVNLLITHENDQYYAYSKLSKYRLEYCFSFTNVSIQPEPKTYKEAMNSAESKHWHSSMQSEMNALIKLGVWKLVKLPPGRTAIKGKWVYKNKLGMNNEIVRRKSRWVAKGYEQVLGRDYFETHSPVANIKSIKLILSLVASFNYELYQMDFDTAFLNADVDADIYMEQPDGFESTNRDLVCKLIKALYGLKQASRQWFITINEFMKSMGFDPLHSDSCVYYKRSRGGRWIIIALYVDDTIIAVHSKDNEEWLEYKKKIGDEFAVKDLGQCHWILNMKVIRDRGAGTITLSQEAYAERLATEFDLTETRTVSVPAAPVDLMFPSDSTESKLLDYSEQLKYQSMVGGLLYAANITRIDVSYIVGQLCRYTSKPSKHHMQAAQRVIRYLYQTKSFCLIFGRNKQDKLQLIAYSDSDWAGDKATAKSTSGVIIKFNGDVISWISKRQKIVAQSTAEAEYIALAEAAKDALWYRSILGEIMGKNIVCTINGDNRSSIDIVRTESLSNRIRHISIRTHFIRDEYNKKTIDLKWIPTDQQDADILTKPLGSGIFIPIRNRLMHSSVDDE